MSPKLSASMEDYLEAIQNIVTRQGVVRVKNISEYLGVRAASVTTALQTLAKAGLVNYKPYGIISLTPQGLDQAQNVIRKHESLTAFFVEILGADPGEAEAGACKIEHVISDPLFDRLVCFAEFMKSDSESGSEFIEMFHHQYQRQLKDSETP